MALFHAPARDLPASDVVLPPGGSQEPHALGIAVRDATLIYGGDALFESLDFDVETGKITCLLGPSGVGKSSLLRLIAGLAPRGTLGRVQCEDGRGPDGRIAFMAQSDLLMPWLSILNNVRVGARLRGEKPDTARARVLLREAGLEGRESDLPEALSGGMKQRTALVRTLMEDRPIVLMDEPFSALDAVTRARLQALAVRLLQGRTVLLVTHDPMEALRVGDVIHVMAGRPARIGPALRVPGMPPRAVSDAEILPLYEDLMARLVEADRSA